MHRVMKAKAPDIKIITLRDFKVVLDVDLARVYGVTTKRLNETIPSQPQTVSEGLPISTYHR